MPSRKNSPKKPVEPLALILEQLRRSRQERAEQARKEAFAAGDQSQATALMEERLKYSVDRVNSHPDGYRGYKNLLYGRLKFSPRRADLLQLTRYLQCSLEETNRVLIAAGYPPEQLYLGANDLTAALAANREVVDYLPLPAFILTRDWRVLYINEFLQRLFHVTSEQLQAVPERHWHLLRFTFDPASPFYNALHPTAEDWRAQAIRNIRGFKMQNQLSWDYPWYKNIISTLCAELPEFRALWEVVNLDTPLIYERDDNQVPGSITAPAHYMRVKTYAVPGEEPLAIRIQPMHLFIGDIEYPLIQCFKPFDAEAQMWFTKIGIPTPDNGWKR